jgi:broad specificity phosphatase PhoE
MGGMPLFHPAKAHVPSFQGDIEAGHPVFQRQVLFLVRHAESRWNQAQWEGSITGMMSECDHGITQEGRRQAETLRERIAIAAEGDSWTMRFGRPSVIFISPLTRALQTAVISLVDVIAATRTDLAVLRTLREKKNLGSRDSAGLVVGPAIKERLLKQLENLYSVDEHLVEVGPRVNGWPRIRRSLSTQVKLEMQKSLLKFVRQLDFDTNDVQDCWWNRMVETDFVFGRRLNEFMQQIRLRGKERMIIVGHSHFFRRFFRAVSYSDTCTQQSSELLKRLRKVLIPNCGVIGLQILWTDAGELVIEEAVTLFGTDVREMSVSGRMMGRSLLFAKAHRVFSPLAHHAFSFASCSRRCRGLSRKCCGQWRKRKSARARDLEL